MKQAILTIVIVLACCGFIYGCYWVAKTVSYSLFYRSMVEDTVREMVKPGYLRKES